MKNGLKKNTSRGLQWRAYSIYIFIELKFFFVMLDLKDHLKPNILDPTLGPMGFVSWYDVIKGALLTFLQSTIDNSPIPIDEDDFVIRLLASMAPILGKSEFGDISDACSDASWTYLINMFAFQQMWALQSKYLLCI